ncbi:MAG: hypothetical protein AAGI17_05980 [Planctomycetota bacterium]
MKLSDLISTFGLWIFPTIGLVGFTLAFLIQAFRVARSSAKEMQTCGELPLDDGTRPLPVPTPEEIAS